VEGWTNAYYWHVQIDPTSLFIVHYPAPVLRQKAQQVKVIDAQVRAVAARLFELMHDVDGLGLAAPQVGLSWRLFVTKGLDEEGIPDLAYVNPVLSHPSGELAPHEEGCLSLPGITAEIRRPSQVTIAATDLEGKDFTMTRDDLLARVWQHEADHLDGVLILDRMNPIDRLATRKQLKQLEAEAGAHR
jgi:peptide deformylase